MNNNCIGLFEAAQVLLNEQHPPFAFQHTDRYSGVKIDSRKITLGDLFIALPGQHVDGHHFVNDALNKGAVGIVVEKDVNVPKKYKHVPIIKVSSCEHALGKLAGLRRRKLFRGKVIALTGSNGKTTIKNILSHVLSQHAKTQATPGNYNNEIGLPLTLLSLSLDCQYWVLEIGARHLGNVSYLCEIAEPDITFISNIGHAHISEFGSREKQLQAKGEILSYGKLSILDVDSSFFEYFAQRCNQTGNKQVYLIASNNSSSVQATQADVTWSWHNNVSTFNTREGEFTITLPLIGEHNAHNVAWAVAVAKYCGLSNQAIACGLGNTTVEPGRMQFIKTPLYTIVNDAYNASPESIETLLQSTKQFEGVKLMVFGDMAEIGNDEEMRQWHMRMAEKFKQYSIDWVLSYGELAQFTYTRGMELGGAPRYVHCQSLAAINQSIYKIISDYNGRSGRDSPTQVFVFLKASNKMNLSSLIPDLLRNARSQE